MSFGERHNGRVGDVYVVADSVHANRRSGSGQRVLHIGDRLTRTSHGGDCFCDYAITRDGVVIGRWAGYDLPDDWQTGNVVDDMTATPGGET